MVFSTLITAALKSDVLTETVRANRLNRMLAYYERKDPFVYLVDYPLFTNGVQSTIAAIQCSAL